MASHYFGSRYFAAGFFGGAAAEEFGGYFGAGYFGANYFRAGFYGPITITSGDITATVDATEAADSLDSTVTVVQPVAFTGGGPRRRRPLALEPIHADLDALERPDSLECTVSLGFNPVDMDNDLLLMAA